MLEIGRRWTLKMVGGERLAPQIWWEVETPVTPLAVFTNCRYILVFACILLCTIVVVVIIFVFVSGGSVTAGLGIYDTMQYIRPPVATWCVGQASSMASLLLCSGTPGMRHSLPNSRIMIHQPSGQASVSCPSQCRCQPT